MQCLEDMDHDAFSYDLTPFTTRLVDFRLRAILDHFRSTPFWIYRSLRKAM